MGEEFEKGLSYISEFLFSFASITLMAAIILSLQRDWTRAYTDLELKVKDGRAWSCSKRFTIPAGGSQKVLFANDSDRSVKLVAVEVVTFSNLAIDIYSDVSVDSHGSKWTATNLNLGSDYMVNAYAEDGGSYSGGTLKHQTLAYGGAKNFAVGSLSEVGEGVVIPPSHNIMLELVNLSSSQDVEISVRFIFTEE